MVFSENMKKIKEKQKNVSYTLGITPFASLTFKEFKKKFLQ